MSLTIFVACSGTLRRYAYWQLIDCERITRVERLEKKKNKPTSSCQTFNIIISPHGSRTCARRNDVIGRIPILQPTPPCTRRGQRCINRLVCVCVCVSTEVTRALKRFDLNTSRVRVPRWQKNKEKTLDRGRRTLLLLLLYGPSLTSPRAVVLIVSQPLYVCTRFATIARAHGKKKNQIKQ